jgi:GT2 family glycosyltransferase
LNRGRALIVVNYFSAALAARAIASARRASSAPLHVIVVDNSVDLDERLALESAGADELICSERNVGYGTAVNAGLGRCRAEHVVVANPDVVFRPGAIDGLLGELREGVGVTGPRFSWDEGGEWLLPPADFETAPRRVGAIAASRVRLVRRMRERRRIESRLRFWASDRPAEAEALSGAVMAFEASVLRRIGAFDERFHLYFEEIDLVRRLRRAGLAAVHVPAAVCRHIYNQSAGRSDEANSAWVRSERLYHEKWSGCLFARRVLPAGRVIPPQTPGPLPWDGGEPFLEEDPAAVFLEASPLANFDSAAGFFPRAKRVLFPEEIAASYLGQELNLRVVRARDLKTLRVYRWQRHRPLPRTS